ncbi:SIMPL domain-containing protein [Aquirhabdus parva]|nr:SIMPL domain-containing protein [Aquirhabdus parva]
MSTTPRVIRSTPMQRNFLLASILGLSAMVASTPTFAEPVREHRIVNLQAETSRDVQNDEMQATLYTELNNTNPTTLARDTAQIVNKAMDLAKAYPSVKVSSGTQSTYPIYSDKNKLTGWRGRAEIQLKTSDFKAGSELIAQLQSNMQLEAVNFSVSAQQRLKVENELLTDITKIFRERASLLQNAWGASKYELVEMNITSSNDEPRPYPMMMRMAKAEASDAVPAQAVQSGNSKVRVQANGSIQLQ